MNWAVFDGIGAAADRVAETPGVRVVLIRGEGRSFSSGIDLNLFSEVAGDPPSAIARAQAPYRAIAALPMPTIAAVRGHAYGAGLQLALTCDVRVVAADASLGLLEVKYGLIPDLGATALLPRLVGPGFAKSMMWTGRKIDGVEAARLGLAEVLAETDLLDKEVESLAEAIESAPPLVVGAIKRLMDAATGASFGEEMDLVAREQTKVMSSGDFMEAITAWLEKRKPDFKGA